MKVSTVTPQNASGTSPDRIVRIATGFMAAKQLFAASRVGLFAALTEGPLTAAELAGTIGRGERITRILADALNSLGLLDRTDGRYSLTPEANEYLVGEASGYDLAPFFAFLNGISYPHWEQYFDDTTVDSGEAGRLDFTGERMPLFMGGVMTYNGMQARELAKKFDFRPYRNALDYGGLSADFAIEGMKQNPELKTTYVYAPGMGDGTGDYAIQKGISAERVTVSPADTVTAQLDPGRYDLVIIAHVLHRFSEEENKQILANARAAAAPGATLVVFDFYLDDDERQRYVDAVHAGEFFVIDGTTVYPQLQVTSWLEGAGWNPVGGVEPDGSPRAIIAKAI